MSGHLVFEITVICIAPEINSYSILTKGHCLSIRFTFYA